MLVPSEPRAVLSEKKCEDLDLGEQSLDAGTGLYLSCLFLSPKIKWFRDHSGITDLAVLSSQLDELCFHVKVYPFLLQHLKRENKLV